jgi:NADH dehydrogenase FAD-containing subunit
MLQIVLVHPGKYLLPELGEDLGRYVIDKLAARGIEVRTGVRVNSISYEGILLSDSTYIGNNPRSLDCGHVILAARGRSAMRQLAWPRDGESLPCGSI